jgi:acetylornithine deacetylase/succinyl-diaminopimelate desuccinylase-like protein
MVQDDVARARKLLLQRLDDAHDELVELCRALGRNDSQNPPGDTRGMVATCRAKLDGVDGIEIMEVVSEAPKVNLVARLKGKRAGRRLVMNGHLDTGPVVEPARWTVPPFGGVLSDGRIYGRGIADMKAGLAADVLAMRKLADVREHLGGELVLMLVADEGTGGRHGTQHVLAKHPELAGDAMVSGDVGSPRVARIGEKGFIWIEIEAQGKSAAGAHPHLGDNAIERLVAALAAIKSLEKKPSRVSPDVKAAVEKAAPISEKLNGAGETHVLTHNTVNIGMIQGGIRINNVPSKASAKVDIRIPPGGDVAHVRDLIAQALQADPHVQWRELDAAEPNCTAPDSAIVKLLASNAQQVLGDGIGISIRPGFSDGRFFRQRGVPTVVYGVTPHNGNAPDEYVLVSEMDAVFKVHALTAFDFLSS